MHTNRFGYTVGFIFLLTFVLVGILAAAQGATIGRVEVNEIIRYRRAVENAVGTVSYSDLVSEGEGVYRYLAGDGEVRVRRFSGAGVWGQIVGVIAIDTGNQRVLGVEIIDHAETPGLGGRVAEDRFLDQLRGERIADSGIAVVIRGPGNSDPDDATIDGITGATGTTRAFARILESQIRLILDGIVL